MMPRALVFAVAALALAGCGQPVDDVDGQDDGDEAQGGGGGLPTRPGGLPTRPTTQAAASTAPADTGAPAPAVDPLSDFEEALVGTWRRYHVSNSGEYNEYEYYEYVAFNEDRTACAWKYGQDSSSSLTDDLFDSRDYSHWAITQELYGSGTDFLVEVEGAGIDYVFEFAKDRVRFYGFETLLFYPTTDGKSCFVRDGPSY